MPMYGGLQPLIGGNDRFRRGANRQVPSQKFSFGGAGGQERGGADMTSPSVKIGAAYAELVLAAADTRPDPTTERFDARGAPAVAAGQVAEVLVATRAALVAGAGMRSLCAMATSDAPDGNCRADNYRAHAINAARRGNIRRRVLAANHVAATGSATDARPEQGEGRR